jgi:hypothetical protein
MTTKHILHAASDLASDDGENFEYDQGLVEFIYCATDDGGVSTRAEIMSAAVLAANQPYATDEFHRGIAELVASVLRTEPSAVEEFIKRGLR